MNKVIIENRTDKTMVEAVSYVLSVMQAGRISGSGDKKQYCYTTLFKGGIYVSAFLNKNSDRFVIHRNDGS